ncbi:MAG: CocE/NonD family hydrolase [Actinomycetota bacterium]|nr:CocE/NonD family hydrolase [Actinomycetota bacterium]
MPGHALCRRLLVGLLVGLLTVPLLPAAPAAASPNTFVTMSDGVQIALNVRMPDDFKKGRTYPTIFEMSGYDGGSSDGDEPYAGEGSRVLTKQFYKDYVTVHASVRGTGCSGGEFDLFSWRSALDGRELIHWIAQQPWSDGEIGIYGHSYGGITGFMVAATRPPELDAVSVSGLIDDIYRGIVYPGGVSNYGFPLLWTGGVRNAYDIGGGFFLGFDEGGAEKCLGSVPSKSRTVLNDPIVQGIQDTDSTWMQARSLINYAERIEVPIHISGAYQDEQTGPRGPYHLFEEVVNAPVRRLLMTNGDHGTQQDGKFLEPDRNEFLDAFLLAPSERPGQRDAGSYPPSSVVTFLENVQGEDDYPVAMENRTFPLETTRWRNLYFGPEGRLSSKAPGKNGGSDRYFSGSPRQGWSYQAGHTGGSPFTTEDAHGMDELVFSTPKFKEPTAIIGPSTATLFMSSTAPDTEIFVQVIDEGRDGSRYFVQRGMLKASHRAIMRGLSDRRADGTIYRPHRPHTNPTLIEPGKVYEYLVEIFPLGHVFRPGHRLIVKIHTPPAVDSYYAYIPRRPAGVNTLYHDAKHPSSLMLPFVPLNGVRLKAEPKPCTLEDIRCVPG